MLRTNASRPRGIQRHEGAPVLEKGPAIACGIGLVAVAIAVQRLPAGRRGDLYWIATLLTAIAALALGKEVWHRASRVPSPPGKGWRLIAAGCWVWSIGWIIQLGLNDDRGETVPAVLANAGYLTMLPLFLGGLVLLRPPRRPHRDGVKLLLDHVIALSTLLALACHWVIRLAVESDGISWTVTTLVAVHTIGDGILVMTLLIGLLRAGDRPLPRTVGLLAGSLSIIASVDLVWVTAWAHSGIEATVPTAPAWFLGFFAVGVAVRAGQRRPFPVSTVELETGDGREPAWRVVILYPMALLLLLTITLQALAGERNTYGGVVITVCLIVVVLIIARLGLTLRESQRITRDLTEQVDCDPLTGLINHRKVHLRLDRELSHARACGHPVAVALIDVDNFKEINDRFGHQAGDRVLRTLASVLKRTCRGTDIAARYAGDEFMLVLPGLNLVDARKVGFRLLNGIARAQDRLTPGSGGAVGVSIGLAVTRECNRPSRQLVSIADAAMYDAKAAGKNRLMIVDADTLLPVTGPRADRRDARMSPYEPIAWTRLSGTATCPGPQSESLSIGVAWTGTQGEPLAQDGRGR